MKITYYGYLQFFIYILLQCSLRRYIMINFKIYKKLTIDDSAGFGGQVFIYEIISNGPNSNKFIAIPIMNTINSEIVVHENGMICKTDTVYTILSDFVNERPNELSEDPETALYKLFANMYKQKAEIKSREKEINPRFILSNV